MLLLLRQLFIPGHESAKHCRVHYTSHSQISEGAQERHFPIPSRHRSKLASSSRRVPDRLSELKTRLRAAQTERRKRRAVGRETMVALRGEARRTAAPLGTPLAALG